LHFLKHLERTRLLLHLVDVSGIDPEHDPMTDFATISAELEQHDPALAARPRWVVLTKIDATSATIVEAFEGRLREHAWQGPIYRVSAIAGTGCEALMWAIYNWLKAQSTVDDGTPDEP